MFCVCNVTSRFFFILTVLFFNPTIYSSTLPERGDQSYCAQIFFQPNFQGPHFYLNDLEQVSDLKQIEAYFNTKQQRQNKYDERAAGSNGTTLESGSFSFRVQDGCELRVSPLPYLKGKVQEFVGDVDELPPDWLQPKSVACQCPQECQCEVVQLRQNECGRAYIKDDCTRCKFTYTSLKLTAGNYNASSKSNSDTISWEHFPEIWSSEVTSIILRENCSATLLFSSDPPQTPPNVAFIEDKIAHHVNASGNLTHYVCQCPAGDSIPSNNLENTNKNYPLLVTVPRTKGAINSLLSSRPSLQTHPGLMAALQSLRSRRSSRNAYILLLGMSGSGKSSAVNLLFDHPNITKVGDYVSTTKDILQFSIPVPVPSLGLNNTALHVIDTPGIGDTEGITEDARFLATLEKFLSTHPDLRRSLPNVILIFSKFSDNRFDGEGSSFVKMLRTLDLFKDQLIDKRSTNVIFVLTNFMSETKELTRDPSNRIAAVRRVIQEYCTLPRPIHIVVAENKPEESFLLNVNGFYQLPNGEYYPKNLFDQMQRSLVNSEDPLGEVIIQTAFSNSDKFQIQGKRFPLLPGTNEKVTQYLGILGALNKPVAETPVSLMLTKVYDQMNTEFKATYPDELAILLRHIYARKLWEVENIPKTSTDIIKLLEDVQINPLTLRLLQTAFNVTVPDFPAASVVGSGFTVLESRALPTLVFDDEGTFAETSEFIFTVPKMYQVTLDHGIDNHFEVFTSEKDLYAGRLTALGFSPELGTKNRLSNEDIPVAYNLVSLQEGQGQGGKDSLLWNSLTATVNYHTYQVSVSDRAQLSREFTNIINNLKPLNLSDPENVETWQNFFHKYGTHVVTGAFAGGAINIKTTLDATHSNRMSNAEKLATLSETLANITEQLGNELIGKDGIYRPPVGVQYQFFQKGGNSRHYCANFSALDETHSIEAWRASLKYEPVILMNRLKILPIGKVVRTFQSSSVTGSEEELEKMMEEAASNLLNASLLYLPLERMETPVNPGSRDRSKMKENDYQQMLQFAHMFRAISESSQASQKHMLEFIREADERKFREEQQYEERMRLFAAEQAQKDRLLQEQARNDRELQQKREQLEIQRAAQERLLREQQQENQRKLDFEQWVKMEEIRQKNEQQMMNFIIAENRRRDEIMRNRKGVFEIVVDVIKGRFNFLTNLR